MGIIAGALCVAAGNIANVRACRSGSILLCHAAIALGTLFGGWRIVKTMGMKITKLQPVGGFCAETAGAITLLGHARRHPGLDHPHHHRRDRRRRLDQAPLGGPWGVAGRIVWAWLLTIPISAAIAAAAYILISRIL